ncbi:lipid-A-disaccharide synthase [Rhodovulum sp. DZ06]|uniref:lipid-A-disaccharide synthase n=1 Tax=Rhodovulum sp. DZ06 TaxID=3425126 RepID=UPI003D32B009
MRLVMVSGEPSGDRLGAPLIRALKARGPVEVTGVGGPLMQEAGLVPLFDNDELAVMGLAEVVPKIPALLARIRQTADHVTEVRPDALITVDSPSFGLRVAAKARAADPGLKTIHYVAPSVWAWRPGRAKHMAAYVDHVLALLPFEPPWMTDAGMTCDFVGHPVIEHPVPDEAARAALRADLGIGDRPMLVILPGSRNGEVSRIAPPFGEVLARVQAQVPGLVAVVPAAGNVADAVKAQAASWPGEVRVLDPRGMSPAASEARKFAAFAACDAALAASGTVSLELAAMGAPQVIAYRMNPLTAWIAERLIKVKYASLVNILLDAPVAPEFLQRHFTPDAAAGAVTRLLTDKAAAQAQRSRAAEALEMLGRGGPAPSERAADSVLRALGRG